MAKSSEAPGDLAIDATLLSLKETIVPTLLLYLVRSLT